MNVDRETFIEVLQPLFASERSDYKHGSPFRSQPEMIGGLPRLNSTDQLSLVPWFLKSSGRQYSLCSLFEIKQSTVVAWPDYALKVHVSLCRKRHHPDLRISWQDQQGLEASASLLRTNCPHGLLFSELFGVRNRAWVLSADYVDVDLQNASYEV